MAVWAMRRRACRVVRGPCGGGTAQARFRSRPRLSGYALGHSGGAIAIAQAPRFLSAGARRCGEGLRPWLAPRAGALRGCACGLRASELHQAGIFNYIGGGYCPPPRAPMGPSASCRRSSLAPSSRGPRPAPRGLRGPPSPRRLGSSLALGPLGGPRGFGTSVVALRAPIF